LIRFGRNLGKIEAKLITFGQNQNVASPKTFNLLRLMPISIDPLDINISRKRCLLLLVGILYLQKFGYFGSTM